jgi:serine/threonine protein kinase
MKRGDVVGGYVLTTDVREGGGHSQWAFAEKDGTEFFIKQFLAPTFPVPGGPGSEKTRAAKRERCEEFERNHRLIMNKLRPISGDGGNLVITKDFFRDRAHYYKVTTKVDVSDIGPKDIAGMPRNDRILIMLTASRSLDTLHKAGLVHGDVTPENLLIKALEKGFAIKVIDFDNCFPAHKPPEPEQLVGDPAYYSPELMQYILGKAGGNQLDEKNDVFALGLVFWQYLAGERPMLPDGASYAAEAVQEGAMLTLPKAIKDRPLADLVISMLAMAPVERPSMGEVHTALRLARRSRMDGESRIPYPEPIKRGLRGKLFGKLWSPGGLAEASFAEPSGAAKRERAEPGETGPVSDAPGKLRGRLVKSAPDGDAKDDTGEGKLRGSLLKRKE